MSNKTKTPQQLLSIAAKRVTAANKKVDGVEASLSKALEATEKRFADKKANALKELADRQSELQTAVAAFYSGGVVEIPEAVEGDEAEVDPADEL